MEKKKKDLYIEIIYKYKDMIDFLRDKHYDWQSISEYDSVYQDILDYEDDRFYYWREKYFIEFIDYLNHLIQEDKDFLK